MNANSVGKVIKEERVSRHLSQDVLSGLAGIARTHLSMIETGTKQPNFETICRIAAAFNLKPSELVKLIEEYDSKLNH